MAAIPLKAKASVDLAQWKKDIGKMRGDLTTLGTSMASLNGKKVKINLEIVGGPAALLNINRLTAALSALAAAAGSLPTINLGAVTGGGLGGLAAGLGGGLGLNGALQGVKDFALEADKARITGDIFARTINVMGGNLNEAQGAADKLANKLKVTTSVAQDAIEILVRQGFTLQQANESLERAAASGLKKGISAAESFDAVADAVASGLSARLNSIGVAQNLSTYFQEAATKAGLASKDMLTDAQKAAAITKLLRDATTGEFENLDNLIGGVAGSTNELNTSIQAFKISFGKDFTGIVNDGNKALSRIIGYFGDLDPSVRRFGVALVGIAGGVAIIVGLGAAAVAAGPLFVGLAATIATIAPELLVILAGVTLITAGLTAFSSFLADQAALEDKIRNANYNDMKDKYGPEAVSSLNQILTLNRAMVDVRQRLTEAEKAGDQATAAALGNTLAGLTKKRDGLRELAKTQMDANQAAKYEKEITEALKAVSDDLKKSALSDYQSGLNDIKAKFDGLVVTAEKIKNLDLRSVSLGKIEDSRKASLDALERTTREKLGKDLTSVTKANAKADADAMEDGLAKRAALRELEIADVKKTGQDQLEAYAGFAEGRALIEQATLTRVNRIRAQGHADDQKYIDDIVKQADDAAGKASLLLLPEGESRLVATAKNETSKLQAEYQERLAKVTGNIAAERQLRADQATEEAGIQAKLAEDLKKSGADVAKATRERLEAVQDAQQDANERFNAARDSADQAAYQRQLALAQGNAQAIYTVELNNAQTLLDDRNAALRTSLSKERSDLLRGLNERLADEKLTAAQRSALTAAYLQADSALFGKFYADQSAAAEDSHKRVSDAAVAAAQEQVGANERTLSQQEAAIRRQQELLNGSGSDADKAKALDLERQLRDTYADQAASIESQLQNREALRLTDAQVSDLREKQADLAQKGAISGQQELQNRQALVDASRDELVNRRESAIRRQQELLNGAETQASRLEALNLEQGLRNSYADQLGYIAAQLKAKDQLHLSDKQIRDLNEQQLDLSQKILLSAQQEAKARKQLYTDGVAEIMARREFQLSELEARAKDATSTGDRLRLMQTEAPLMRERIALQQAYVAQLQKSGTPEEVRKAQQDLTAQNGALVENAKAQAAEYSKLSTTLLGVADAARTLHTTLTEARKLSGAEELQSAYDGLYSAQRRTDVALNATVSTIGRVSAAARGYGGVLDLTDQQTQDLGESVDALNTALDDELKALDKLNTEYDRLTKTAADLRKYASGVAKDSGDQGLLDSAQARAQADYTARVNAAREAITRYGAASTEAATALGKLGDARAALDGADDDATGNRKSVIQKQIDTLKRARDEASEGFDGDTAKAIQAGYDDQIQAKQDQLDQIDRDLEKRKRARATGEAPFAQQALTGADRAEQQAEQVKATIDSLQARIDSIAARIPQGFEAGLRAVSGQLKTYGNEWGAILASSASAAFSQQFQLDLSKIRAGVTSVSQTVINQYTVQVSGSSGKIELTDPEARRLAQQLCEVTSQAKRQGKVAQGGG